jgi:hypothetical protein
MMDSDGPLLAETLEKIFKDAGFDASDWPEPAMVWRKAGIFLIVQRLQNVSPHIVAVQRCLWNIGIEARGEPDPKHPDDAVSIGIGPRL